MRRKKVGKEARKQERFLSWSRLVSLGTKIWNKPHSRKHSGYCIRCEAWPLQNRWEKKEITRGLFSKALFERSNKQCRLQ